MHSTLAITNTSFSALAPHTAQILQDFIIFVFFQLILQQSTCFFEVSHWDFTDENRKEDFAWCFWAFEYVEILKDLSVWIIMFGFEALFGQRRLKISFYLFIFLSIGVLWEMQSWTRIKLKQICYEFWRQCNITLETFSMIVACLCWLLDNLGNKQR